MYKYTTAARTSKSRRSKLFELPLFGNRNERLVNKTARLEARLRTLRWDTSNRPASLATDILQHNNITSDILLYHNINYLHNIMKQQVCISRFKWLLDRSMLIFRSHMKLNRVIIWRIHHMIWYKQQILKFKKDGVTSVSAAVASECHISRDLTLRLDFLITDKIYDRGWLNRSDTLLFFLIWNVNRCIGATLVT